MQKEWGIGNNLMMQEVNAIFHENIKERKIYYFYVHILSDFEKHNNWTKHVFFLILKNTINGSN